jgi:hypothetical protein
MAASRSALSSTQRALRSLRLIPKLRPAIVLSLMPRLVIAFHCTVHPKTTKLLHWRYGSNSCNLPRVRSTPADVTRTDARKVRRKSLISQTSREPMSINAIIRIACANAVRAASGSTTNKLKRRSPSHAAGAMTQKNSPVECTCTGSVSFDHFALNVIDCSQPRTHLSRLKYMVSFDPRQSGSHALCVQSFIRSSISSNAPR